MTQPIHGLDPNALEAAPARSRLRLHHDPETTAKALFDRARRLDQVAGFGYEMADFLTDLVPFLYALSQNPGTSNTSEKAVGVKVKPLEWHPISNGDWSADGALGKYQCLVSGKKYIVLLDGIKAAVQLVAKDLRTHVEAKAAAQADYEQRVLASLEPRASDRERTIEECAKVAHKAHLTYAQLRDTHRRDTLDWAEADASTKAAAAIWHAIGDLLPRDPNDPTEAAIRKLSEVSHEH